MNQRDWLFGQVKVALSSATGRRSLDETDYRAFDSVTGTWLKGADRARKSRLSRRDVNFRDGTHCPTFSLVSLGARI